MELEEIINALVENLKESKRAQRKLMDREELHELDYGRVVQELGYVGDWILQLTEILPAISGLYKQLVDEKSLAGTYQRIISNVERAMRNAPIPGSGAI